MKRHLVTAVGLALILIAGLAQAHPAEDSTRPDSEAPWRVEDALYPRGARTTALSCYFFFV
jgi:hypothetical protein